MSSDFVVQNSAEEYLFVLTGGDGKEVLSVTRKGRIRVQGNDATTAVDVAEGLRKWLIEVGAIRSPEAPLVTAHCEYCPGVDKPHGPHEEASCTCDDIGESPCPVHFRENLLQNQLIELKEAVKVLSKDMHQASERPCTTCQAITKALGESFGCVAKAVEMDLFLLNSKKRVAGGVV